MAVCGELRLYATNSISDIAEVLSLVTNYFNPKKLAFVTRTINEDHEWANFLDDGPGTPTISLKKEVENLKSMNDISSLYLFPCRLHLELCESWITPIIIDTVTRQIPTEIRNDFIPADLSLWAGPHDIIEEIEELPGAKLIARSDFSLTFFGYSTPFSPTSRFVKQFMALPEIVDIRNHLEKIVGPMKISASWSF